MNLHNLAGDTALIIGLLSGIIQLLDWTLPKTWIERISYLLTHVWVWLAEQRAGELLKWLSNSRPIKWLIAILLTAALFVCIIIFADTFYESIMPTTETATVIFGIIPGIASSAALFLFRISQLARWITSQRTSLAVLQRVFIACVCGAIMLGLVILFIYVFERYLDPLPFIVLTIITSFIFLPMLVFTVLLVAMLCWLIIIGLISGGLWSAESFVRKVIESPKGPVLAVGAFLAAIGAILKSLP